jgi:hypothetical protein
MAILNLKLHENIEQLLNSARPLLIKADKGGGSTLFNKAIEDFGPLAHEVFLELDLPFRTANAYHDSEPNRVLLDPKTVLNRAADLNHKVDIDDLEFWMHGDMIKTLCDYLDMRFGSILHAST